MSCLQNNKKIGIITGGTRGIGLGCAIKFAENGFDLLLAYNSNDKIAEINKEKLEKKYHIKVLLSKGDLADENNINNIFKIIDNEYGYKTKINSIVHNAGLYLGITTNIDSDIAKDASKEFEKPMIFGDGSFNLDFKRYDYYQNIYPKCFIRLIETCIKDNRFIKDESHIVAISSPGCNVNQTPREGYDLMGQGKTVIEYLVRYYSLRLAINGININSVIPGYVVTDAWKNVLFKDNCNIDDDKLLNSMESKLLNRCPMKRATHPTEIGELVYFLCSNLGKYITGVSIPIDGGLHLK